MRKGSFRAVLWLGLACLAAAGGCAPAREYVSLSYQPLLGESATLGRGPTIISIPGLTDAREGMTPSTVGYLGKAAGVDARTVVLVGDGSLAETMTDEVARLYRLHGFEVVRDPAIAEGRIDGELRGKIVSFVVTTPKGGPLGRVEGEGQVNLELWHPTRDVPLWMATLKASSTREYQWSMRRGRSTAVDDLYSQLLRGVERSIPSVERRIDEFYETGK